MRADLSDEQWDEVERGQLRGPDARQYVRRTTRTKRKDADQLVRDGVPLVLYYWADRQLDWFDGPDAQEQWQAVRSHVIASDPRPTGDTEWTAGRWEDQEGRPILLLTGHC